MGLSRREQILAIAAIACIGLWAGRQLVLSPLLHVWKERSGRTAQLEVLIRDGERTLRQEEALRTRWAHMQANAFQTDIAEAENRTFRTVSRCADASRLALVSLRPRRTGAGGDFQTLEFQATARGDLRAIARFLYELESDPLPLKVEEIEISAPENQANALLLGLRFSGLILAENDR